MSDFERPFGFQDCWTVKRPRAVRSKAAGYFSVEDNTPESGEDAQANAGGGRSAASSASSASILASDKATLARVVRGTPEVMVKVTTPAKFDKSGNVIPVNRSTEGVRVAGHFDYISRNGKIELETSEGQTLTGKTATGQLMTEWLARHDEDRGNGLATDRTRIVTRMVLSMPAEVNAEAVKDAVRTLAEDEFGGRHDYVMALHTDTKHPHVHLTVRTVGHDGIKLNLRKADLEHLRDHFAQRLRQRGIEAEATPRHARGVTRKSEKTPIYKMRQKGKPVRTDQAKRAEVKRDMEANGGPLQRFSWDKALLDRRNRVLSTYMRAASALALSDDPADRALAKDTERFAHGLTDLMTEREQMAAVVARARSESLTEATRRLSDPSRDRGRSDPAEPDRGPDRGPDKGRGGRGR